MGSLRLFPLLMVLAAVSGCGSTTGELSNVDLAGQWVLRDSSNIIPNILPGLETNPCILRMPLIITDAYPEDTLWLAEQDTGATMACGQNGPPGPPGPVGYFGRQFIVTYRGDSIIFVDAAGPRAYLGRVLARTYASGLRDRDLDGRPGTWTLTRPGF